MVNIANTIEANAVATLKAVQRLGQLAGNDIRNRNGNGNANDEGNAHANAKRNEDNMGAFYKKYFPESARKVKEMELMQLKQGSMSVAEYTNKFEELCRFSRVCQGDLETYESWRCIKYQSGLKDSIMTVVAPMEICVFSDLVNKARVVEEYAKTVATFKDTHGGGSSKGRGKYHHLRSQSFKRGGYAHQGHGGFRKNTHDQFQRGKGRGSQSGCFNCGLPGHIAKDCTRGKNLNTVKELGLKVSELPFDLHVHTPHQTVMTRSGCRQVGFKLERRDFVHDLICLPMVGLEMILGGEECQGYILLTANASGDTQGLDQIPVVRDFSKVFPEDIPEFPPQREIEFAIELVPRAGLMSVAPYRMAPKELAELKVQLEELLNNRFIRPSVSP
ncbi:uncharacterized protein LOC130933953 [Arachis stenosperma]|uniref:uncharacterized protein LOC130933953 n=1 Tax=Arachis stenosperma TaxID=217475 RepID=UPI0025AB5F3A|nr:uncharacterized protein LOC130933953 [Arachis stenosperma]